MSRSSESFSDRLGRLFGDGQEPAVNSCHPKTVTLQVTEACNLCCTYCYQGRKTAKRMSLEVGKRIIDMLLSSDERTDRYITSRASAGVVLDFIGGEPLLEAELIDRLLDYFVERTFRLHHPWAYRWRASISSNGTLYFEPRVQALLEKWKDHLSFSISIDGNKELHDACRVFPDGSGSYDIAMAAAKDYMAKGGELGSKMTIAPGNVRYVERAVLSLLDAGYSSVFLNCVYEKGWTLEHAKILYRQLTQLADKLLERDELPCLSIFDRHIGRPMSPSDDRNWCGGTGLMLAADTEGRFFPCIRYMESSLNGEQPPFAIGDLAGICRTDEQRDRVQLLSKITRSSQSTEDCCRCPIASGCSWCSGYNYQCTGTPNKRVTYICPMHKARVLANCYYWNKLLRGQGSMERFALHIPREWALEIVDEDTYDALKELAKEDAYGDDRAGTLPCP